MNTIADSEDDDLTLGEDCPTCGDPIELHNCPKAVKLISDDRNDLIEIMTGARLLAARWAGLSMRDAATGKTIENLMPELLEALAKYTKARRLEPI